MARPTAFLPLVSIALIAGLSALGAESSQTITVKTPLKIPEATLDPGKYDFSVEDLLSDRTIVRIANSATGSHYLVLTVPDARMKGQSGSLLKYRRASNASPETVRAWACPGCDAPLAFVYPKAEAAQITADSAEAALAVDPSYDKLPGNLSPDDMKVVTLWLLTPKEITPDRKGEGVNGVKWADAQHADAATQLAGVTPARRHLPKTAGDTYQWALAGILLMVTGWLLRGAKFAAGHSK